MVRILFFLEDDSIAVVEPPVENSGIAQGVLIKRQLMPKNEIESYGVHDFNLATNITFYGKTFRIVSCDKFTQVLNFNQEILDRNREHEVEQPRAYAN